MKKLLILLALSSPAFGQVYSQMAIQNTTGNWLKASPGAAVYLCALGTLNANCLAGTGTVSLYTDSTLAVTTANPVIADLNGNYTLFTRPGVYLQCVKGQTSFCQQIEVGGGTAFLMRTNSPTGTVLNQLVTYDTTHLDANGVATVQNAPTGSKGVIGVCIAGCGTSGIATIGTYLSAQCVMDGGATVGDLVSSSSGVGGFCNDYGATEISGVQTVGRVAKANSGGAGTTATIDFFLGDIIGSGSGSGPGLVQNPNCVGTPIAYYPSGLVASVQGDCFTALDGAGHGQMKGIGLTDTSTAGFLYQTQGTQPTLAASNSIYHFAPTTVGTTYGFQWPAASGTGCLFGTPSGSVVTLSFQNPCGGGGISTASALNPSQPTVTPGGTPQTTTYTYGIIGCQDVSCIYHSKISTLGSTTTGNATLSTSNYNLLTLYADTLYGYRGYLVCRTVGGATQGIITGGLLADKAFKDTGLTGDGTNCVTNYATNTTILSPLCLGSASPGSPTTPGFPCGVDGPPLTPNAMDHENGNNFGAPGDVNDGVWTWGGGGTSACAQNGATAVWSGGAIVLTTDSTAQFECLEIALPSTPYTFKTYVSVLSTPATSSHSQCSIGFRESSTGKMWTLGLLANQPPNTVTASGGYLIGADNWSSSTAETLHKYMEYHVNAGYITVQNTGSNLVANFSSSGDGVSFFSPNFDTETVATGFTTAPNQLVIGGAALGSAPVTCMFDFVRRTQ